MKKIYDRLLLGSPGAPAGSLLVSLVRHLLLRLLLELPPGAPPSYLPRSCYRAEKAGSRSSLRFEEEGGKLLKLDFTVTHTTSADKFL